jgi:RES domain-containing protein
VSAGTLKTYSAVRWPKAYRIIASRYPPIHLYERLTQDQEVWDALIVLEQRVNPRLRDELGEIALVPQEERVSGPGASWVMAAFTHVNRSGSRFSDGTYGVYYASNSLLTAIRETVHHFEKFARDAGDAIREEDMRVLCGKISGNMVDASKLSKAKRQTVLQKDSYQASQAWARMLRERDEQGIVYPSTRDATGLAVAAFRTKGVGFPRDECHLKYHFNGTRVDRYFDYRTNQWTPLSRTA